jgi:RNA polymerase sigma-70 factor (ECF subfamily)
VPPIGEEELMAPLFRRSSDDAAFERLYRRHAPVVYRYSLAVLGERADAEDVTQATFLNAYRAFRTGERPLKPENWLIAIAHNVCRQRFRQAQRRPQEVEFVDSLAEAPSDEPTGPSLDDVRRALSQLQPSQREALVLRELEGRSYAEMAEILQISPSALETLLFRARRALREQLEESLTCEEAAFAISKEEDGRLSSAERRALRSHLRSCPECATAAKRERALRGAFKRMIAVPLPASLAAFSGGGAAVIGSSSAGFVGGGLAMKAAALIAAGTLVGGSAYVGVEQQRANHRTRSPTVTHAVVAPLVAMPGRVVTPAAVTRQASGHGESVARAHGVKHKSHAAKHAHPANVKKKHVASKPKHTQQHAPVAKKTHANDASAAHRHRRITGPR